MESHAPGLLSNRTRWLLSFASVAILVGAAKAIASILNLVLLSLLLALTIRPLVEWLCRRGLKRGLALLVSFAIILVCGIGIITIIGASVGRIHELLPVYQERLEVVFESLRAAFLARGIDISGLFASNALSAQRITEVAQRALGGISSLLSAALLGLLLIVLFLSEMPIITRLLDRGQSQHWTQLTAAIQKYIGITGLMGFCNAVLNLVLLLVLGVDFPVLWAVLCFFFNFVPAVGNLMSLTPPAVLALLEFGWGRAGGVVAGYFVTNLFMDMVVKPRLMSTSLDISPLLVILSLIFWGWVLGPAGAILAVPLTIVVKRMFFGGPQPEGGSPRA